MLNRTFNSFVPYMYRGFKEIDDLMESEQQTFDILKNEMIITFFNTFVLTSNEDGVIMFERMLNIVADPESEDLPFRKQRIINRLSMKSLYTFRFLKQQLDNMVGVGKWKGYIDFDNYALYIESSASDQSWYHEVSFTVNQIKPCNITFVNVPYMATSLAMTEEVSYSGKMWMYRLGSWKLGEHPFHKLDGGGLIKMTRTPSIRTKLLQDTAEFVANHIVRVKINKSIEISEFKVKQADGDKAIIEYEVTNSMTDLITNIWLIDKNNAIVTECTVYVPITLNDTVICKHLIALKEGE